MAKKTYHLKESFEYNSLRSFNLMGNAATNSFLVRYFPSRYLLI